jgi:Protein of unknown function (DUF1501)
MTPNDRQLLGQTRRHFFKDCGVGLGKIALGSLLADALADASGLCAHQPEASARPLAPRPGHHRAKAKNVIFLFMAGGPSQLEMFDHKPKLNELDGQLIPESYLRDRRFAFMNMYTNNRLLAARRRWAQHGRSGAWVSDLLPHIAGVVDELAILKCVATDVFNHAPAKLFMNTGTAQFGRPAMGSWVTYGIGSEAQDLPGFVVLQSGLRGPRGGAVNWSSGFVPTVHQGVPFRTTGEPILSLSSPAGINGRRQGQALDVLRDLNTQRLADTGDAEIATRIASYEMAFRMQTSAPELIDLARESRTTLQLYGAEPGRVSFANNCLLARRLVERGVRFVQLYHTDWDHHGDANLNLEHLPGICREVDQPIAGLIRDLKQRGLLDDTLVIWGGEFGRTPMGERRATVGRNHHIDAFTMFLAGAGIKPGVTIGSTDELGFSPVEDRIHVHDLHATILHLLGLDHLRLTYRFQGRDFRLTDVEGEIAHKILT